MPRGKANDCYKHLIPSIVGNGSHWFPANINHPESLIYQPNIEIPAKDGPVRSENLAKIPAKDGPVRLDKDFIESMEKYLDGVVESLGEDRGRRKGRAKRGRSSKTEGGDEDGKTKSRSAAKERRRSKGARGKDGDEDGDETEVKSAKKRKQ
jgi:hypothetical protein